MRICRHSNFLNEDFYYGNTIFFLTMINLKKNLLFIFLRNLALSINLISISWFFYCHRKLACCTYLLDREPKSFWTILWHTMLTQTKSTQYRTDQRKMVAQVSSCVSSQKVVTRHFKILELHNTTVICEWKSTSWYVFRNDFLSISYCNLT